MKKSNFYFFLTFFLIFSNLQISYTQIIINEVYADVAVNLIGDANGDEFRSAREDEFIELFNPTDSVVDISGFEVLVSETTRHLFPDSTVLAAKAFIVIFGGGQPNGLFGGSSVVLASSGSLNLSNQGATIVLINDNEMLMDSLTYTENNIDASLVRTPEFTGDFIPHTDRPDAFGLPFSPGTLTNSFPYNNGDTTLIHFTINRGTAIERDDSIDLFLNLINPKSATVTVDVELIGGTGTASDLADFTTQTINFPINSSSQRRLTIPITDDEFVEGRETFIFSITNINSPDSNQISINQNFELTLFDDDTDAGLLLTEFLADPPTGLAGDANGVGDAIVQKASTTSLSLNNNGDRIIIRDSLNELVFFHEFEEEGNANQSLVLCPITTGGDYMEHSAIEAGTMLSPGQLHVCSLVSTLPEIYEKTIQIYPNPTNDFLTVNFSDELVLEKIDLLNSQGKSLLSTFDPYFYVTSLPKGVYFLRLKTDKGIIVKKVIVD